MSDDNVKSNHHTLVFINGEVFRIESNSGETWMLDFERYRDNATGFASMPSWIRVAEPTENTDTNN